MLSEDSELETKEILDSGIEDSENSELTEDSEDSGIEDSEELLLSEETPSEDSEDHEDDEKEPQPTSKSHAGLDAMLYRYGFSKSITALPTTPFSTKMPPRTRRTTGFSTTVPSSS